MSNNVIPFPAVKAIDEALETACHIEGFLRGEGVSLDRFEVAIALLLIAARSIVRRARKRNPKGAKRAALTFASALMTCAIEYAVKEEKHGVD